MNDGTASIWPDGGPRDAWHSFDSTPWLHPWLSRHNLRRMRGCSALWREEARRAVERAGRVPNRFAFVGNMANDMYIRAKAIARSGAAIEIFGLHGDTALFSDPRWEDYDGDLPESISYLAGDKSFLVSVRTTVPFHQCTVTPSWAGLEETGLPPYARIQDYRRWPQYFCDIPTFEQMQGFDAVLVGQRPHIGYLAAKPYVFSPTGDDIWYEASRDDSLGRLLRAALANAGCVWVSNPWTYAHARRYGLNNLLYLPLVLDENDYSPGPDVERERWKAQSGGDFFVLSSMRAADFFKGSQIGLAGFAEFARRHPGARLVFVGWGGDVDSIKETAAVLGLADRVLFVALAGKRKLISYLRSADCLLDQFKTGYFGLTGLEACACGLPVIIRLEEAQYAELCETGAPPFLNAATGAEVVNALDRLAESAGRRREIAEVQRDWFLRNHSGKRWAEDYRAVLAAVALGHRFSFDRSPLTEELSPAERRYHAERLHAAPEFPNYRPVSDKPDLLAEQAVKLTSLQADLETQTGLVRAAYEALLDPLADAILRIRGLESELTALYNRPEWRIGRKFVSIARRPVRAARKVRRRTVSVLRRGRLAARLLSRPPLRMLACGVEFCFDRAAEIASWRRLHCGRPRTMWGVTPILTLAPLARCDRLLGLRSDSLVFTSYYIGDDFDINFKKLWETVQAKLPHLVGLLHRLIFRWALIRYDTFNLFCDHGLLPPARRIEINEKELRALRRFNRRLYTYTYGADVRTREATLALGRFNICAECPEPGRFCICDDAEGKANIARIRASATAMIAMGDMLNYVPGARIFNFWPIDTAKIQYVGTSWATGQVLRVGHAPNHPHFKGTPYLIEAVERLRGEGRAIELVRVQGVPNNAVLTLFASCDLVVDQFIAGFHGYTMFEAMAVGKPVLCYLRNPLMVTDAAICPVINTWPDTVYDTLRDCLDGRFDLGELGRRSRAYIERYHSLEAVALHLGALYLETAAFPERVNRRIRERMETLKAGLPPALPGRLPVPWDRVAAIGQQAEELA